MCECMCVCLCIYNLSRPCLRWLTLISDHYSLSNPHSTPSLTVMAPLSSSVLLPFIPPMFTEQPETTIDCLTSSLHTRHPIPYRKPAPLRSSMAVVSQSPPPPYRLRPHCPKVPLFELETDTVKTSRMRKEAAVFL